jgi:hypothetical protein
MEHQGSYSDPMYNRANFFTPVNEAIEEAFRRKSDIELNRQVRDFLDNDIPPHLDDKVPVCYMARHVATPNFETLKFIELAKPYGLPIVISQDLDDIFTPNNSLKKTLGKLPVQKSVDRHGTEIIENFSILNFSECSGKKFKDIHTKFGDTLESFHSQLFNVIYPNTVKIVDESDWINRNYRGNLVDHYKKSLALMLTGGVLFEWYPPSEKQFVEAVLEPAFDFVVKEFGVKPLIVELVHETEEAKIGHWESYPSVLYPCIKKIYSENLSISTLSSEMLYELRV